MPIPEKLENIITSADALPALSETARIYRAAFIALETFNLSNKMSVADPRWFELWTTRQRLQDDLTRAALVFASSASAYLELIEVDHG